MYLGRPKYIVKKKLLIESCRLLFEILFNSGTANGLPLGEQSGDIPGGTGDPLQISHYSNDLPAGCQDL
jgi:hypothetical protein